MRRTPLIFVLAIVCWAFAWTVARAQQPAAKAAGVNIFFKDGRQAVATGFRLDGATLLVTQQVGNGVGEVGYPLASVEKVEFPEPAPLTNAPAQLAHGKDGELLAQIDPIVAYYGPFRNVPGNWWLPAALAKVDALAGLKRERDVDALLAEITRLPGSVAAVEAAKLRTAEAQLRRGSPETANKLFDELIRTSTDDDTLARAWIGKGRILLDRHDFDPALLAYLHVSVFYPESRRSLATALLGSGRAFVGIDNRDKAREAFQEIIHDDPSTTDATEAKAELQKLDPSQPAS